MKYKALIIVFSFLTFPHTSGLFAQLNLEWSRIYHTGYITPSHEQAISLCIDENRSVYVFGQRSASSQEIVKYNNSGTLLWTRYLETGTPTNIIYAGNQLFVTGSESLHKLSTDGISTSLLSGRFSRIKSEHDGYLYTTCSAWGYMYVLKLDVAGDTIWSRIYGQESNYEIMDQFQGIEDRINVIGTRRPFSIYGNPSPFYLNYSSNGELLQINGYAFGVVKGVRDYYSNSNFVVGNTNPSVYHSTILFYKINSQNVAVDTATYDGPGNSRDEPTMIATDNNGGIYVACKSWGVAVDYDFVILKFSTDCELLWEYRYNGSENSYDDARIVRVGSDGNIYASGVTTMNAHGTQIRTVKLSSSGNLLWADNFSASTQLWTSDSNYVNDMQLDSYSNIYICGKTRNKSTRKDDYLTFKYGGPTSVEESTIVAENFGLFDSYPNPFNPEVTLRFSLARISDVKLSVFDALGNKIDELVSGKVSEGLHEVRWNAGANSSGVYFFVLVAGNSRSVKKGVLLK